MQNLSRVEGIFFYDFIKVDSDYKPITHERYELVNALTGAGTGVYTEIGNYNQHTIRIDTETVEDDMLNAIPEVVMNEITNVSTRTDLDKFNNYPSFVTLVAWNNSRARVNFTAPVRLQQVVGEPGYKKDSFLVPMSFEVNYYLDGDQITDAQLSLQSFSRPENILYNYELSKNSTFEDLVKTTYLDVDSACLNYEGGRIISDVDTCTVEDHYVSVEYDYVPYFVTQKGTVTFKVDNTVNGLAKFNASKDKNLEYKIRVTNTGDTSSSNNIITTYVPNEIEVIESSISSNGTYNKDEHTITWTKDLINEGETVNYSYKAIAPESINGKELIGKSSISSDQVLNAVYSNNTIVTMDKIVEVIDNPETGMMVYIANTNIGFSITHLMLFTAALALIILFLVKKMIKMKRHN